VERGKRCKRKELNLEVEMFQKGTLKFKPIKEHKLIVDGHFEDRKPLELKLF
jgi:hypothetical protein